MWNLSQNGLILRNGPGNISGLVFIFFSIFHDIYVKNLMHEEREKSMLIDLTYHCSMGCTHCMSDCKQDGNHMSLEVFADCLEFCRSHQLPGLFLSGGEVFEHPEISKILDMITEFAKEYPALLPVTIATNGRVLSANMDIYEKVVQFKKSVGSRNVFIQVTDDLRFYPNKLTEKQKYRLRKLDVIIDTVPSSAQDEKKCLYPQGRALKNYDEEWWNTKAPKCVNVRLIAKQLPESATFHDLIGILMSGAKLCTPTISPAGEIKLGESALCPSVASIYDDGKTIMEKIRGARCSACTIPIGRLKKTDPMIASLLY